MWMEETIGTKVNDERSEELLGTGASRIATACPFCYIMIDDGVKGHGVEDDQVKVADISIHLVDALEAAEAVEAAETAERMEAFSSGGSGGGGTATLEEAPPETTVDDLTRIEGIGPKTQELLNAEGITSFAQLAAGEQAQFEAILDAAENMPFTASTTTWARQAQFLVDGDEDGFQEYTDHLDGGVEPE